MLYTSDAVYYIYARRACVYKHTAARRVQRQMIIIIINNIKKKSKKKNRNLTAASSMGFRGRRGRDVCIGRSGMLRRRSRGEGVGETLYCRAKDIVFRNTAAVTAAGG